MLTMSQINCIRDLSKQGYDISKIHTCTGVDRKTIRKYLEQDDFSPKPPVVKRRTSIVALDLCQYFEHKKLKGYADFFNSSSSFCCGVI